MFEETETYHRLRYENGTSFRVPVFLIAPPHPFVWGRFYPRKPPVSAPRFPQDQGVESKAKQTSTNPQRHGYLSEYFVSPTKGSSLMRHLEKGGA